MTPRRQIFTIGHSTRTLDELVEVLSEVGIGVFVDIRRFPSSRRHPQFRREFMEAELPKQGIRYEWLGEALGGRRKATLPPEDSPNRAWQVPAFRAYADAMETETFRRGVEHLEALARSSPTAYACAERVWWRCHRRILSDLLTARGWRVVHLLEPGRSSVHELTGWARVDGDRVTYPGLL